MDNQDAVMMTFSRYLTLSLVSVVLLPLGLQGQGDTTFVETFDDGTLTENPAWTHYLAEECLTGDCITIDSTQYHSAPYSLKISTDSVRSAIESITGIFSSAMPFQFTTHVYVESMGDEAIPCLMRGANTVLALFLLRNNVVQLTVLKNEPGWVPVEISIPGGYALGRWHAFTIHYNGQDTTALYIDGEHRGDVVQPLRETPIILQLGNRYLPHRSTFYVDDMTITTDLPEPAEEPGKVYLILGSDTGTWDGMNVNNQENYYRFGLFSDPGSNAARVIDPAFRSQLLDSYNEPLVFTWWLIGGSMMVPNTNPEVEYPWISNLEMIRKYRGEALEAVGDELALHYHNWIWSDPDSDGTCHWNQSVDLDEYRDDFLETVGRMALEGDLMPTSFRSGWHYMSNEWMTLIDSLIPYRLENDAPHVRSETAEPIDNIYDWSRAPLDWVPYHPDAQDYQSPGDLKGWETRSVYMKRVDLPLLYDVFLKAYYGTDQVMTIWSHLPEGDFPEQILNVDSLVNLAATYFPDVMYDYLTATEGMQKWRGLADDTPPVITLGEVERGDTVEVTVTSDEPIWQAAPFTYAEEAGGEHLIRLFPEKVAPLSWRVVFDKSINRYRVLAFAMTDTSGNAAVKKVQFDVVSTSDEYEENLPSRFELYPAYPNPFNASTVIRYTVPRSQKVTLKVYDLRGREVATLMDRLQPAGIYQVRFDGRRLPSGIYVYRFVAGEFTQSRKMLLLK